MSQHICVVGTVATDPKLQHIGSGVRLCSFRLGSSERRYDRAKEEWVDGSTNWFTVNVFHQLGEHAAQSLAKGQRIIVQGKLKVRNWERDGAKGTAVEIEADAVGHDLRWGVTEFTKMHVTAQTGSDAPGGVSDAGEGASANDHSDEWALAGTEPGVAHASTPF